MKEHEKSFCRARVALEEGRKLEIKANEDSNSGEQSPASVSPPPTATQEAVSLKTVELDFSEVFKSCESNSELLL